MLCFRCEHRASFLENKGRPRYECGCPEVSKHSCYMFTPCKPIILKKDDPSDPRPASHNIFGCRMQAVGFAENIALIRRKDGALFWEDNEVNNEEDRS